MMYGDVWWFSVVMMVYVIMIVMSITYGYGCGIASD